MQHAAVCPGRVLSSGRKRQLKMTRAKRTEMTKAKSESSSMARWRCRMQQMPPKTWPRWSISPIQSTNVQLQALKSRKTIVATNIGTAKYWACFCIGIIWQLNWFLGFFTPLCLAICLTGLTVCLPVRLSACLGLSGQALEQIWLRSRLCRKSKSLA